MTTKAKITQTNYPEATAEPTGHQFAYPLAAKLMVLYGAPFLPADTLGVLITFPLETEWATGVAKSPGDYIVPTVRNGFLYVCTNGGTTGGSEPTWPTTIGDTINDNGVEWTCDSIRSWTTWQNGEKKVHIPQPVGGYEYEAVTLGVGSHPDDWYFIWYDSNNVLTIGNFGDPAFIAMLQNPMVACLVWDDLNHKAIALIDLRYDTTVSGEETLNTILMPVELLGIGDNREVALTDPSMLGTADREVQWYVDYSGGGGSLFIDHNLIIPIDSAFGCPQELKKLDSGYYHAEVPIIWMDSDWYRKIDATAYPIHYDGTGGGRMHYNKISSGVTEAAPSGTFVAMYILAKIDSEEPYFAMMGQRYDTNLNDARANNVRGQMAGDLFPKCEYIARVIYYVNDSIGNVGHAYAVVMEKFGEVDFNSGINQSVVTRATAYKDIVFGDSPYTMDGSEHTLGCNSAGGAIVVNLPSAVAMKGLDFIFIQKSASNKTTLTATGGATIGGAATVEMNLLYEFRRLVSDGTNWWNC